MEETSQKKASTDSLFAPNQINRSSRRPVSRALPSAFTAGMTKNDNAPVIGRLLSDAFIIVDEFCGGYLASHNSSPISPLIVKFS